MSNLTSITTLLAAILLAGLSFSGAAAQVALDDAFALGVVLDGRSEKESTKRAVFKMVKLEAAHQLFTTDKPSAMKLLGFDPARMPPEYVAAGLKYTKEMFFEEYSKKVDDEIAGITFGDLALSKVAKVALTGVTTYYSAGASLLLRNTLAGGSALGADYLNGIALQQPATLYDYGNEAVFAIARRSFDYQKSAPILATEMKATLVKYADIQSLEKLKETPEYKAFVNENDLQVVEHRVKNSEEAIGNLDKKIADRIFKVSKLEKQNRELLQKFRAAQNSEDVEKTKAAEVALRENQNAIRAINVGFAGLDVFARLIGAPKRQIQAIQATERAAEAIYAISKAAGNPMTYMGGYFTLAAVAISMFQSGDNSQDGISTILVALKQLSEQIDEFRMEMAISFNAIDAGLARGFAQQTSLLEAIKLYEQGQTQELVRLYAAVQQTREELRAVMDAYAKRQQEALWSECLSVPLDASNPADEQLLRRCLINAQLMAVRWSSDDVSVATSMSDLESSLSKASDTALALARVTPVYANLKFKGNSTVANPQAWLWGANLTAQLLEKYPATFKASSVDSIDSVLVKGKEIQYFYQTLFASRIVNQNKYHLDTSFIIEILRQYVSASETYLETLSTQMNRVVSPWVGPDQPLPEEHVSVDDIESGRAYRQETSRREIDQRRNAEIVNTSSNRRAVPGRGAFNQDVSKGFYTAATAMLRACSDMKKTLTLPSPQDREIGQASFTPDLNLLNGNGLKLDSSVLTLIPRPALWLERLNPGRFTVELCVENYSGASAYRTLRGPDKHVYVFNVSLTVDVRFVVIDHQRPVQAQGMKVGSAKLSFRSQLPHNQLNPQSGLYPVLTRLFPGFRVWPGLPKYDTSIGPAAGKLDYYFATAEPNSNEAMNLAYVRELVAEEHRKSERTLIEMSKVGDLGKKRSDVLRCFRQLMALRLLNSGGIPEVDAFFNEMSWRLSLYQPDQLDTVLLRGVSLGDALQRLSLQLSRLQGRARTINGVPLGAVTSPVDSALRELELLKQVRQLSQ
ncbi:hypothetical protein OK142_18320 [Agrobacterium sp. BT-220-3]|nr:hypothetical protein [Agrobacterium sp. BT-220-3]